MRARGAVKAQEHMMDDDPRNVAVERLERRLAEEGGRVRIEIGGVRTEVQGLRAEMIDRNAELLKWILLFFVAQTAALAALMRLFR